jgi:hypothetical protein
MRPHASVNSLLSFAAVAVSRFGGFFGRVNASSACRPRPQHQPRSAEDQMRVVLTGEMKRVAE